MVIHLLWDCEKTQNFITEVSKVLMKITELNGEWGVKVDHLDHLNSSTHSETPSAASNGHILATKYWDGYHTSCE